MNEHMKDLEQRIARLEELQRVIATQLSRLGAVAQGHQATIEALAGHRPQPKPAALSTLN